MPRLNIIIDDFSMGEVSPLTEARVASTEFRDGVRELTNLAPDTHGPLMGRPGFEFIDSIDVETNDRSATCFQITFSQQKYYVVVMVHQAIVIYDEAGTKVLSEATTFTDVELHGPNNDQHFYKGVQEPLGNRLVVIGPDHVPHEIVFDLVANTATFAPITFTEEPAEWSATAGNYPTTLCFFQGRSWWSGCAFNPTTFWSSKSNEYFVFSAAGSTAPDDSIVFQIARQGQIRWMEASRNLLIGTDFNEFIAESEGGVLIPGDVTLRRQSSYGSCWIQPRMIGNEVLYMTSDFRQLRSMWYRLLDVGGWQSNDATYTAEHITLGKAVHMTYARNPFTVLFLTLTGGTIACCIYYRHENGAPSVGWYRMSNPFFQFRCSCAPERDGRSEMWITATKEGDTRVRVMRKAMRDYQNDDEIFLDCHKTVVHAEPTETTDFTGVDFFSVSVDVIADGFHYPNQVVNPDGTIILPNKHLKVSAGHPYPQRMISMPMIMRGDRSTVGHQKKRWNKAFLRLIKSYRPLINGKRPPERFVETNNDVAEPFIDGFVQILPSGGWDRSGILTVEQDLPFRLLVTGIYGEFSSEQI